MVTSSYFGYVLYIDKNCNSEVILMIQITINTDSAYVPFEFFSVWAMEIVTV